MSTWLRRARAHAIGLAFVASLAVAQAPVSSNEGPPLTLRAAISQALEKNPALEGFAHRLRAQDGRIQTAAKGESEPVVACTEIKGKENSKNKPLIACLQPNRRVVVEVEVQRPTQR